MKPTSRTSRPYHSLLLFAVIILAVVNLAVPAAFAQPDAGQRILGTVVERHTQAPLPGAAVIVLHTAPLIGTTTDQAGRFVLEAVPLGRHDIQVSFLGYEPVVLPQVLVAAGKQRVLHVVLSEQVLLGEEIVVRPEIHRGRAQHDFAAVSARSFSVEETRRYAGGLDDPARMAAAFAGVSTGGSIQENALSIRGHAPKGVQWRLEGVEIPNPNHFAGLSVAGGGGLTLFSSQLLADGDVFTGAFPAEYGNALAGVFDLSFRTGNPERREHTVQAGLLGIEVASEGPFDRSRPHTYLFNYRYATLGLLLPLLPTEDLATYQDLSFKVNMPTRKYGRFALWGIGGRDRQAMTATEDSSAWQYETWDRLDATLALSFAAAGLSHDLLLSRRTHLRTTAAVTANRTRMDQQRLHDDLVLRDHRTIHSTTGRFILGAALNHKFNAGLTSRAGFQVHRLFYRLDLAAAPEPEALPAPVANGRGGSALFQFYAQAKAALTPRLTLNAGAHLQHLALTGHTALEPRAGLRWAFRPRQALSLGYGLHSQAEALRFYLVTPHGSTPNQPNRALDFTRAHHLVLGYTRLMGDQARLQVESYYQYLYSVPVIPDSSFSMLNFEQDFAFRERLVNQGAGANYGLELTLERFLHEGYYVLITGSAFRARYRGGDGIWRHARFDRRYAANALAGREFTLGDDDVLGLNGRLSLTGGKRQTPIDYDASQAAQSVVYDAYQAFAQPAPGLLLLDVTITYRRNHARLSEVWALQVKNLLAAQETIMDYNYALHAVEPIREGFPLPVLSYKIDF